MAAFDEKQATGSPTGRWSLGKLHRPFGVVTLIAILLVGLDSSDRADAGVSTTPQLNYRQLVSPMAVVAASGLAINRLIAPDGDADEPAPVAVELDVQSGDTLIVLLARLGIVVSDAYAAVDALKEVFSPRDVRPGWTLRVMLQPQTPPRLATLRSLAFQPSVDREINVSRRDANDADPFLATTISHPLHRVSRVAGGTIKGGLFDTALAAGVPHDLLADAIALFSFEVDFQRDIHAGDAFEMFYDTLNNAQGEMAKSGELYYAKLVLNGKDMQYYRFTPHNGFPDLFSPDGHSIRKALLQTPVDATRISSGYGMRRHPILGYTKMHKGVDFAAPSGSPVHAAGDGVVVIAGRRGTYGNYVRIRHNKTYSTAYAHLKSFARGISPGAHVHQGQVIAYVGMTGRATGPHLHYEVLVAGKQVNPRGVRLPAGQTLAGADLRRFKQRVQEIDAMRASRELEGASTVAVSLGCKSPTQDIAAASPSTHAGC